MPTIELPKRPMLQMFTPFPTKAYIDGNKYIDDGTHLDTRWVIIRVSPRAIIYDTTEGSGVTSVGANINLVPGTVYAGRMRYKNETGWSGWSRHYMAQVPTDLAFASISIPSEPIVVGTLPIEPDEMIDLISSRPAQRRRMATGHLKVRLIDSDERFLVRMVWTNLPAADKETLRTFLNTRVRAAEAFATNDVVHGTRAWFVRNGAVETIMKEPNAAGWLWTVTADCVQVYTDSAFTVGVSEVGGDDPIS